jgi:hypothetical protein
VNIYDRSQATKSYCSYDRTCVTNGRILRWFPFQWYPTPVTDFNIKKNFVDLDEYSLKYSILYTYILANDT